MKTKKVAGCKFLICPAIYETDRRTYIVQGKRLSKEERKVFSVPDNDEELVEVPHELINEFVKSFSEDED